MRITKPAWCSVYLYLFSHHTSTCFGLASSPSSGGNNVYMQQLVCVVRLKADSQIPCRSPAALKSNSHIPCRSPATTLPFSDANSYILCRSHAVPLPRTCRSLESSLLERHGMYESNTRPHCLNQMGKTQSKPLAEWHGRGTAWCGWILLSSTVSWPPFQPGQLTVN
jgi:hypothetical protein